MTDARSRTTARSAAVPRRPARVLRGSTALLAASALALAGCSGSDDSDDGAPASDPAASAPSASPSPSASPTPAASAGSDAARAVADALAASRDEGSGTFDFSSETSAAGQVVAATGQGSFDSATGALQMQLSTSGLPGQGDVVVELRQVEGNAYVSGVPGQPAGQFVQVPLEELGAASGPLGGADPSQQLTLLEHVGDDVEQVGQEQVDGVETTHYSGVVDLEAAAEQAEGADAEQLRQQYEQLGLSTVPFDLFVGPDGLPVRMATTVETSAGGQQVSSTSTVDFDEWGADVQVEAPEGAVPLSEVTGAPTPAG